MEVFFGFFIKPTMSKKAPKTVLDKVVVAIRELKERGGSSRIAIRKYLASEFSCENANAIKTALAKGIKEGVLLSTGQRFTVSGDPEFEADPANEVTIEDLTVGSGSEVEIGDEVCVSYRGTLDDGTQFDAASTFRFTLGAGDVIKGWDRGIQGMKVGGKRSLVVPPKLGYGMKGSSPNIPPNATLHFKITLKSIN